MGNIKKLEECSIGNYEWDYDALKNDKYKNVYFNQHDWNQTLITMINEASHVIRVNKKNAHKEENNFWPLSIIASPEVCAILDDLEYFYVEGDAEAENIAFISNTGDKKDAKYIIYKDDYTYAGKVMIAQEEDCNSDNISKDCVTSVLDIKGIPTVGDYK